MNMTLIPTLEDLLSEAARGYAHPTRPTKAMCYGTLRANAHWGSVARTAAGLPRLRRPTRWELARAIDSMEPYEVYAARHGAAAARRRFRARER